MTLLLKCTRFAPLVRNNTRHMSDKVMKIKEIQKKMQIDDGVPVYLKGGTKDKLLFQGVILGLIVGMGMGFHTIFLLATKS